MRVGLGEAISRFLTTESTKHCVIGGVMFEEVPGFSSRSDGDVVFQSLCRAITSLTGAVVADDLLEKEGITDSRVYLERAAQFLKGQKITYVSISLEAKRPRFMPHALQVRQNVAAALGLKIDQVGFSAITAEGLTDCGCGDGVRCASLITTVEAE